MNAQWWGWLMAVATALLASGCTLRNLVTDQAQIDSMTYCGEMSKGGEFTRPWGRRAAGTEGAAGTDGKKSAEWAHFSLGEFACKTQDEWLCQARNGFTECDRNKPLPPKSPDSDSTTQAASDTDLQRYRNETVAEMMMQSDRICDRHLASIFGTQTYVGLTTDIAGSLLSGGAAIASGFTARNLTAGAAMVGATKSHISADVYQGKVATAINLIIRKERNATRSVLRSNQSCSLSTYTAAEAVQDALNYHNMCSFEYGLSELVREASDTSPLRAPLAASLLAKAESELQVLRGEMASFSGSDDEKADLKSRIGRMAGKIDLFRAFGVSDVALPVASAGSAPASDGDKGTGSGNKQSSGTAGAAGTPAMAEPRSCH